MRQRVILIMLFLTASLFAAFSGSDYSEAMRMAVKFFGGQRCGNTHNWMLVESTDPKTTDSCHTKDACNGKSVAGGWHDCGDHIKVAVTMGYAAICLLSAYDIWPTAFEDDHDQNYVSGKNKIPDVLDEVKVATDYFMKCLIDGKTFVYYVGNDADHSVWVTSSFQSTLGSGSGGDPRPVASTQNAGGAQAADYASALALMAMHYPDEAYSQKCKEAAVAYYEYAIKNRSNVDIPNFYTPGDSLSDEYGLAGMLMYRLTEDEKYKTDALDAYKGRWESAAPLAWDTKDDIAYYYMVVDNPMANNGESAGAFKKFLRKNVLSAVKAANSNGIPFSFFKTTWGTNKLACGTAFSAALFAKLVSDTLIADSDSLTMEGATKYNQRVIDYMLGNNEFNHPFIHGYKGDMTHKVHHRNAMGNNEINFDAGRKNSAPFMFKSGALIGGPSAAGKFSNIVEGGDAFKETESGCDYNGPFVAALASIIAKVDPKVNTKPMVRRKLTCDKISCRIVNGRLNVTGLPAAASIIICKINGAQVASIKPGEVVHVPAGIYFARGAGSRVLPLVVGR